MKNSHSRCSSAVTPTCTVFASLQETNIIAKILLHSNKNKVNECNRLKYYITAVLTWLFFFTRVEKLDLDEVLQLKSSL